jgi:hypothetical protein
MELAYFLNSVLNAIAMGVIALQCMYLYWHCEKSLPISATLFALVFTCVNRMLVDITNAMDVIPASSYLFIFALVRNYAMIYLMYYFTKRIKK